MRTGNDQKLFYILFSLISKLNRSLNLEFALDLHNKLE